MQVQHSAPLFLSSGIEEALRNGRNPFDTGGLSDMSQKDIAPHANVRFTPNHGAPTFEVAQQATGETFGGWRVKNNAIKNRKFPFISLMRTPQPPEQNSVGDKFHISVAKQNVPRAFEIISTLVNSEQSPINSWKATDVDRTDPRDTRISLGAQYTLYPKPDQPDGTYSPEYMGKMQALVIAIEQGLQADGIGKSDHKPASDVSAPQWGYLSYRNEIRSDREGSPAQSAALKEEPFFKLICATPVGAGLAHDGGRSAGT